MESLGQLFTHSSLPYGKSVDLEPLDRYVQTFTRPAEYYAYSDDFVFFVCKNIDPERVNMLLRKLRLNPKAVNQPVVFVELVDKTRLLVLGYNITMCRLSAGAGGGYAHVLTMAELQPFLVTDLRSKTP